ncbi:MAG TPA: cupin domain-containing protein [Syntrophobacteraceae bacterium]|nr:cupin domain-containing protein [Syntrophobacteraceae bacterium]
MIEEAARWIEELNLSKHPEGGYYRQTYRSKESVRKEHLPDRFSGPRAFSTAIYYLLPGDEVSRFHRLQSDEVWHFHAGSSLTLYIIDDEGSLVQMELGASIERGEALQVVIGAGKWFGALVNDPASYSLVGCTVSPGFEYEDFEIGDRQDLIQKFPRHHRIIEKLTR